MPLIDPATPNIFSLLEVVLRLRDHCAIFTRNVGGGLEFDEKNITVTEPDKQVPYAFVVHIDTIGKEINSAELYQSREGIIGIIVCVDGKDHRDDATGKNPVAAVQSFSPVMAAIENSLLLWKPTGFVRDGIPTFERMHPLGAKGSRAWMMLEYSIPYRFYHIGYGTGMMQSIEDFMTKWPNYRADMLNKLMVHYKAEGEFPTIVGQHYFDFIPFPWQEPTDEQMTAFEINSENFDLNESVHAAIEDRRLAALGEVPQTRDVPYNHDT